MATFSNDWLWKQPLPPNFEAKYDANQQRYFYINHVTRATTWDDPRPDYYRQQQAQQQQQQQQQQMWQTWQSQQQPQQPVRHTDNVEMSRLGGPAHEPSSSESESESEPFDLGDLDDMSGPDEALVNKLKSQFPSAMESIVRSVLESTRNDESRATTRLQEMGYKRAGAASPSAARSPAASEASRPAVTFIPDAPSVMPDSGLMDEIKKEFPDLSSFTVRLFLVKHENKKDDVIKALVAAGHKRAVTARPAASAKAGGARRAASPQGSTSTSSSTTRAGASSSRTTSPGPAKTESLEERVKRMAKKFPNVSATAIKTLATLYSDDAKLESAIQDCFDKAKRSTSPSARGAAKQPPKKTTAKAKPKPTAGRASTPHSQARRAPPQYKSELVIKPNGPNAEIRQGPNLDNLIDSYAQALGPDPGNRAGPDRGRRQGPQGALGPDRGLARGPTCPTQGSTLTTVGHATLLTAI